MRKYLCCLMLGWAGIAAAGGGGLEAVLPPPDPAPAPPGEGSFLLKHNQDAGQERENIINKNIEFIRSQYPHDGSIQHNIEIEIGTTEQEKKERGGLPLAQEPIKSEHGAEFPSNVGESPGEVKRPAAATLPESYPGLFPAGKLTLAAQSGLLASQVLRTFVNRFDFKLHWQTPYDCRLKNSFMIVRSDVPAVLGEFLKLFSLSAKILTKDKYLIVASSGVDSETCDPATNLNIINRGIIN